MVVIEQHIIKAFRKFLTARLPKEASGDVFKLHWNQVFSMMDEGIGHIPENLKPEIVDNVYERATEYLQARVSSFFGNNRLHQNDWVVATWTKYLSRSVILQTGSEADKRNLPAMKLSSGPRPVDLKRHNGAAMSEQIVVGGNQQHSVAVVVMTPTIL
jgi:hypothetical protein